MKGAWYAILLSGTLLVGLALLIRILAMLIPGAQVTSWWRSPRKNQEVGGLRNSAHLLGLAVDLVPVSPTVEAHTRSLYPVVVNEGDHLHASIIRV